MKKFFFLFIFLLTACSANDINVNYSNNLTFSNDMNFEEFKVKLKEYAIKAPFPNIKN
tara:strand:- start:434 stop:607 length:174 start_codon:yes stop_codon:yes gene_type:complete